MLVFYLGLTLLIAVDLRAIINYYTFLGMKQVSTGKKGGVYWCCAVIRDSLTTKIALLATRGG